MTRVGTYDDGWWPADAASGDGPASPADDETLTVGQVAERVRAALDVAFPDAFWIAGETRELERTARAARARRRGRHWYFELVDDGAGDERPPRLSVKMWEPTIRRLFGPRGRLRGQLAPADGIVLRLKVRADFYAPHGQLAFIAEDVDPTYTLGNLDRQRRELLERLAREGALEHNGRRPLPDVPLVVGLVTASGSAAYRDVLESLEASAIGFRILHCDARMQGAASGPQVCAALEGLVRRGVEAIVIARGGGSRVDLAGFDREDIARAIAACPVPVLTGIGHEIDTSVADAVAHTAFKTPTAAAEFLARRAQAAREHLERAAARVLERARHHLDRHDEALLAAGRRAALATRAGLRAGDARLSRHAERLADAVARRLGRASDGLVRARERLVRGRLPERFVRLDAALEADAGRLARAARGHLRARDVALEHRAERLRLVDPRRVLARGYAVLRRSDGEVVKDAAAASAGEVLRATLRDGDLDVMVRGIGSHADEETR